MSLPLSFAPPRLDPVDSRFLRDHDVLLNVLRLDLIHPFVNGKKWFKLKYNLPHAQEQNVSTVLSFGGAYANHLYALSAPAIFLGFRLSAWFAGNWSNP